MDEMKVAQAKLLRGAVIEKLYMTYGTDIRISALKNTLRSKGYIQDEELKKTIFYLGGEEKRYVCVKLDRDNWADSEIWLTPTGVNLAERDIEDVGVIFDE